jgi:hypothetical protein
VHFDIAKKRFQFSDESVGSKKLPHLSFPTEEAQIVSNVLLDLKG